VRHLDSSKGSSDVCSSVRYSISMYECVIKAATIVGVNADGGTLLKAPTA